MASVDGICVTRDTVVSLEVSLFDAQGVALSEPDEPVSYLHGGYGECIDALEARLEGLVPGAVARVRLEPEQAYGEYDEKLLRVESGERYGQGLEVGMHVEEDFDGEGSRIYRVTDIATGKVVLDGNHPLAGIALDFSCRVVSVRPATQGELARGTAGSSGADPV